MRMRLNIGVRPKVRLRSKDLRLNKSVFNIGPKKPHQKLESELRMQPVEAKAQLELDRSCGR